jgi:hypothetical protein
MNLVQLYTVLFAVGGGWLASSIFGWFLGQWAEGRAARGLRRLNRFNGEIADHRFAYDFLGVLGRKGR